MKRTPGSRCSYSHRSLSPRPPARPPVFFPEILVNTSGPGNTGSDDVAIGKDGEFIVTWSEFDRQRTARSWAVASTR